ncbi:hypothetical protein Bbelb_282380 [Branchiostoma belcheri]|nr:hypothetical protein Bbelb_282380 [Branchiostoma belcheri]
MAFPEVSRTRMQVNGKRCYYYNDLQFVGIDSRHPEPKEMEATESADTGERFDIIHSHVAVEDPPFQEEEVPAQLFLDSSTTCIVIDRLAISNGLILGEKIDDVLDKLREKNVPLFDVADFTIRRLSFI